MYSAHEAMKEMFYGIDSTPHIEDFKKCVNKCIKDKEAEFIFDTYLSRIEELYLTSLGYKLEWNNVACWYDVKLY